ncbi:Amino acid adenylation domain-containing protein [Sulfidibacter corallicola]|uniref:Amino acid adenylation domain-containing protein n=1 Tax=Sulfidibacter corallicola TaxID=2818388 RepID=A0A8A4TJD3_SULCO|nr:non-ribosomal peptide synthetase [Sulfidibacter corallicola]QTD49597.1 amino acid adenylation domain-containing protein [Sulfidibacter corallicola]
MNDSFSLTPMQLGMLYQWRLSRTSGVNLEQLCCRLPESVNFDKMCQAWQMVTARFDALRIAFVLDRPSHPMQVVHGEVAPEINDHDWRGVEPQERETRYRDFLASDRRMGFDLTRPSQMRVNLFRFDNQDYRMLWTFHHIVLDGRSFPIVLRWLFTYYDRLCAGETPVVEAAPAYRQYVRAVEEQPIERARTYWRQLLNGVADTELPVPHTPLPFDKQMEHDQREIRMRLDREQVDRLQLFAEEIGVTFHTLVQAAWAQTISAYTGSADVVFGTVRACRYLPIENLQQMAGMLINTLPFRVRFNSEQTVGAWLNELRDQQVSAREFEAVPLAQIQEWCRIGAGKTLVQTMLMFENQVLEKVLQKQGGPWAERGFTLHERTEFALAMSGYLDEDLLLVLEYNAGVYRGESARDMMDLMVEVLRVLPDYVDRPVTALPTLHAGNQALVMAYSDQPFPEDKNLYELFEQRVAEMPDALAVRCEGRDVTFAELNAQANQLAHYLIEHGVGPDSFVGLSIERSLMMIVAAIGILKSGAAYIPLDPDYPEDRLRLMIEDTQPAMVLTQEKFVERLRIDNVMLVATDEDPQWLATQPTHNPGVSVPLCARGITIYTSGSTGRPKGVLLTHRGLVNHNFTVIRMFDMKPGDRVPQVSTINFDVSIEEIFGTLNAGGALVLPSGSTLASLTAFLEFVERERITVLNLTTLFWVELVHHMAGAGLQFPDSVRLFICGGERATWSAYNDWLLVGGKRIRWINAYGPSETTIMSTAFQPPVGDGARPMEKDPPIGTAIDNYWCYVIDELGRLAPPEVPGELFIGGRGVAEGYLKRPDLTSERFLPDRFREGVGVMYKSGDRCLLRRDGQYEYLDRLDNQVKLRGFRIELGEIEAVLARHPAVEEGAVVVRATPAGSRQLVAYATPRSGQELSSDELLGWLGQELPAFMTPSAAKVMEVFPKAPTGKVDRRNLPDPDWREGAPSQARVKPNDEMEAKLMKVWEEVLGVSDISMGDHFFALGGDSLRAMTLSSRVESELGRNVPLALLLTHPTLGEYAVALKEELELAAFAPLVQIRVGAEGRPPLFLIHSLGGDVLIYRRLAELLPEDLPVFGLQMQGLDRKSPPHETIPLAATDFIERIKQVQPVGPYYLAGYSSGGIVAFEMAIQLRKRDEEVALLGLMDSAIPPVVEEANRPTKPVYAMRFLKNLPWLFFDRSLYNPTNLMHKLRRKLTSGAQPPAGEPIAEAELDQVQQNEDIAFDLSDHFAVDISFFPEYRIDLMKRHFHAFSVYEPETYSGPLTLFRTRRQPLMSPQNKVLGWDAITGSEIDTHYVSGVHHEMLDSPHVDHLARLVTQVLEQLSREESTGQMRLEPAES